MWTEYQYETQGLIKDRLWCHEYILTHHDDSEDEREMLEGVDKGAPSNQVTILTTLPAFTIPPPSSCCDTVSSLEDRG